MKKRILVDILKERRNQLRDRLRSHFNIPESQRNYSDFEKIVDELDKIRNKILLTRTKQQRRRNAKNTGRDTE